MLKKKMILVWSFFIVMAGFISCEKNGASPDQQEDPGVQVSALSKEKIVASNNQFGIDLFKNVIEAKPDTNLMISPLSVSLALSMTLNGAAGETEQAMRETLGFADLNIDEVNAVQKELMENLLSTDPAVLFEIANSIWYRENYPVLESFKHVNQTFYNAEIRELDFYRSDAAAIINGWISDATHGKIDEVIDRIDPMVVMFLINALYFKGAWQVEFDDSLTYSDTFHSGNLQSTVSMMQRKDTLAYYEDETLQAVDLPYGSGQYSMMVLLPKEISTADLMAQFSLQQYEAICQGLTAREGELHLPMFKIEFEMLLNDILKAMGMGTAFGLSADFSKINGFGELYISRVIHKTFVEVNEKGTEAAAVTVVEMREFAAPAGFFMKVNRPFLFIIREKETGSLVFAGQLTTC